MGESWSSTAVIMPGFSVPTTSASLSTCTKAASSGVCSEASAEPILLFDESRVREPLGDGGVSRAH